MHPLSPGRYSTRNSRVVELFESFERTKEISPGVTKTVKIWKGRLLTASLNVDSTQEWEETNIPNTLGTFVSAGRVEGVTSEFDLIYNFGATEG